MIKLLSPPGLLTGLVVMLSVAGGVVVGAAMTGAVVAASLVARRDAA